MNPGRRDKVEAIFETSGPVVRATTLREHGFCSKDLADLVADRYLYRIRTGYYIKQTVMDELSELELVTQFIPQGVIAMFSAAQYHGLTTVNPSSICIALPKDTRTPVLPEHPPITVYKFIRRIYEIGIEEIATQNCTMKIYDRERTVCDFLRMRLQFGEDVAIEVLKSYMAGTKNLQRLYEYADMLQIKGVLKPYVEALL